jgi:hypothetical protein
LESQWILTIQKRASCSETMVSNIFSKREHANLLPNEISLKFSTKRLFSYYLRKLGQVQVTFGHEKCASIFHYTPTFFELCNTPRSSILSWDHPTRQKGWIYKKLSNPWISLLPPYQIIGQIFILRQTLVINFSQKYLRY